MPPRKHAPALQYLCSRKFSIQIIDFLLDIEKEAVKIQKQQQLNGTDPNIYTDRVVKLQKDYLGLVEYLGSIPGALLEKINETCLEVYKERYDLIDKGLSVWVLTKGVAAQEFYEAMMPTNTYYFDLTPSKKDQINIPILSSVLSVLIQPKLTVLNFKKLSLLSSVSENVFSEFRTFLSSVITKVPKLRSLTLCSHNSSNSLPQCTNEHLELLGKFCPELEFLDVSFNKNITGEGLRSLVPNLEKNHPGCVKLQKLYIFDCGVFEKEVAKIIYFFPELTYLGYKETGKVLKTIHKGIESGQEKFQELKLTHVDNLGSKTRRLIASALRCKKPVALAISVLCPDVHNLKLRVCDDDVANLCSLSQLETVELIYHVGSIGSPGPHTQTFLSLRGSQLSSIALICNTMSMAMLVTIAENCPGLCQLWSRSNHLMAPYEDDTIKKSHSYLSNLKILYLRVGEGELSVTSIPEYVMPYLLRNAKELRELIVAIRSNVINDYYIQSLVTDCELFGLEKIMIVVPGLNSLHGILKLKVNTVHALMHLCPNLKKLGNLLSWDVAPEEAMEVEQVVAEMNYNLEVVNKKMTMR